MRGTAVPPADTSAPPPIMAALTFAPIGETAENVRVARSKISAVCSAVAAVPKLLPPTTSAFPFGNGVTVAPTRELLIRIGAGSNAGFLTEKFASPLLDGFPARSTRVTTAVVEAMLPGGRKAWMMQVTEVSEAIEHVPFPT